MSKQNYKNHILEHSFFWNLRGVLFLILSQVLLWIYIFIENINGWLLLVLLILLFSGLLVIPYRKQRSLMTLNQQQRDEEAGRILDRIMADQPVPDFLLYLRPFKSTAALGIRDQKSDINENNPLTSTDLPAELSHGDLETLLSDEFWPPPILGLGQRGEHFGVGRLPTSESHWQDIVLRLIQKAGSIIVVPSYHEGTLWEIEQLVSQQLIYKCIFYLEPITTDREKHEWYMTHKALKKLGLYFPEEIDHDNSKHYIGSLFICFLYQPVSIRIDIDYKLRCCTDKIKINSEILRTICTRKRHNAISSQITKDHHNVPVKIPPGNRLQITGIISRKN